MLASIYNGGSGWSIWIIALNWKVILEAQNLEQPLDNRHRGSRNRDWVRLNTSWGCGDTIIWDLTGLDKSFCIVNATPVLQAELNPNTHATTMIKYSSYSLKYRHKQQNSIIWLKKKKKIDRNWGSGGWKGQSVSWRKSSGLSEPHQVGIEARLEEHKRISSCSEVSPKRWWRKYVSKALKTDENACVAAIIIWNVYIWLVWFIWAFGSFHFNTNDWLFSLVRMFSAEG